MMTFIEHILESDLHNIPVHSDDRSGTIYVLVNGRRLYCTPDFEGMINCVPFECTSFYGVNLQWHERAEWTNEPDLNVLLWACLVHNEIVDLLEQDQRAIKLQVELTTAKQFYNLPSNQIGV
jgi:hypothetical protein